MMKQPIQDCRCYYAVSGEELRKIIKSTIPNAEEKISWGVPFYWYHGALAGFALYRNHISFGLAFVLQGNDRKMLEGKGYATGKKTIQIRYDQKVPVTAIKKMLKAQAKLNRAAKKVKKIFRIQPCYQLLNKRSTN